jgi:hypothetical protein
MIRGFKPGRPTHPPPRGGYKFPPADGCSRGGRAVLLPGKKWIGAFAAALGGLGTLVSEGGIGKNTPLF